MSPLLLANAAFAVVWGSFAVIVFTLLVVGVNRVVRHARAQTRYIRVWLLVRVLAGTAISGLVGIIVMQAFDLWLT